MMTNKSQTQLVREHLEAGYTLTPAKALAEYGIWRLAAVIYKLRERGYGIETKERKSLSGKPYAEYELVAMPVEEETSGGVFGLIPPVEALRFIPQDEETGGFREGDIVKVVGNSPGNPSGSHHLAIPSTAVVEKKGDDLIRVYGIDVDNGMELDQTVFPADLEKVTDYSGLKIEVVESDCDVCSPYVGKTGHIETDAVITFGMVSDIPRPVICKKNARFVPEDLRTSPDLDLEEKEDGFEDCEVEGEKVGVEEEPPFKPGDVVKIRKNVYHKAAGSSVGVVTENYGRVAPGSFFRYEVKCVNECGNTLSQTIHSYDLEKVTDYSGLKAMVDMGNSCTVCRDFVGQTFTISSIGSDGSALNKDFYTFICEDNFKIIPQTL